MQWCQCRLCNQTAPKKKKTTSKEDEQTSRILQPLLVFSSRSVRRIPSHVVGSWPQRVWSCTLLQFTDLHQAALHNLVKLSGTDKYATNSGTWPSIENWRFLPSKGQSCLTTASLCYKELKIPFNHIVNMSLALHCGDKGRHYAASCTQRLLYFEHLGNNL